MASYWNRLLYNLLVPLHVVSCIASAACGVLGGFVTPLFLFMIPAGVLFTFVLTYSEDRANLVKLVTEITLTGVYAGLVNVALRRRWKVIALSFAVGSFMGSLVLSVVSLLAWIGALE